MPASAPTGRRLTPRSPDFAPRDAPRFTRRRQAARKPTAASKLLKLLKELTPGDVVTVTRIDRLARSTFDREDGGANWR